MTTEQKEAIKYLEHLRDEYRKSAKERKEKGEPIGYGTLEDLDKLNALEIDLVLDLIQEQEKELQKKDESVNRIINRLNNDIKRIAETKTKNYSDDYRRCRLKAYKTKTREIKEYIEEQYFERKVEDEKI